MRRPLSPHLGIYRVQITSGLSALHRVSGVLLVVFGILSFAYVGLAFFHEETFVLIHQYVRGWPFHLLWGSYVVIFGYHMANGIRHIFWDLGKGLDLATTEKTGKWVCIWTLMLVLAVAVYLGTKGG